ncbi:MAG: hypothetical protein V3T86_16115 [Planctomycetota bacterium]
MLLGWGAARDSSGMFIRSMKHRLLCTLICAPLLAACSGETPAAISTPAEEPVERDAFLDFVPGETPITVRGPSPSALDANPHAFEALLRMLGRAGRADETFYGIASHEGLAADRGAGLAVTRTGSWVRYLPAENKSTIATAVGSRTSYREEGSLILFSDGAMGGGTEKGEALPRGDLAVRFRFHPLLAALSHPTDQLEFGVDVSTAGFKFHGRLRPGKNSPTREAIAAARPTDGGTIEMLPAWLGLRVETTLPPTLFAEFLAHRLALHTGMAPEDKTVLIRFMREALTAVDTETGFAFGIDFKDGMFSFVATGEIAEGPPSRVLRRLSVAAASEFGAMIFHPEESDVKGLQGYYAWVADAELSLDNLPETAWEMVRGLGDRNTGLPLAYAERGGRFVVAGGPRGDRLAAAALKRIEGSGKRGKAGWVLHSLRKSHKDFVLGAVVNGPRLAGMAPGDLAALRRVFGATAEASAPAFVTVAGFRDGESLLLKGEAGY